MANLTGEYDVAAEVGVGLVNAVLAAIHENDDDAFPTLLHSILVQVADIYAAPATRSRRHSARASPRTPRSSSRRRPSRFRWTSRPGLILSRSRGPLRASAGAVRPGVDPSCWPQISVRLGLRAWLRDVSGDLPPFLHGDLRLTAGIVRTDVPGLGTFLGLERLRTGGRLRARGRHGAQRRAAGSGAAGSSATSSAPTASR